MPKKTIDITNNVMRRIKDDHIIMKPRWYFILGSFAMILGFVGLSIVAIFFVNLIVFSFRTHGPMGEVRYQQILASFPWWAPIIIIFSLGIGIWMLKKYDFSYRKNFALVVIGFLMGVIIAGILADTLGLNTVLLRQKQTRGIYQIQNTNIIPVRGQGNGRGHMIQK